MHTFTFRRNTVNIPTPVAQGRSARGLKTFGTLVAMAVALAVCGTSRADDDSAEAQQWLDRYAAAFDSGDAAKVADCWTPEAIFVDAMGQSTEGREAIGKKFADFLTGHQGAKLTLKLVAARKIGDQAMLLDVQPKIEPAPKGQAVQTVTSMILVRVGDRWLIHSARDTMAEAPAAARLQPLAWLEGEWIAKSAGAAQPQATVSWRWTPNKSFLTMTFAVAKGAGSRRGLEMVGWDAADETVRSWNFDADGSFSSAVWTHDGDSWSIASQGVLADGSRVSATDRLTRIDDDTLEFASTRRMRNGQGEPDVPAMRFQRVKPAESTSAPAEAPTAKAPILPLAN